MQLRGNDKWLQDCPEWFLALQGIEMYGGVKARWPAPRIILWVTTFDLWTVRGPAVQHRFPFADK